MRPFLFVALAAATLVTGCRPPGVRALLKGKDLLERGKLEPAVAQLRTATALLPTNAQAFNYLGLALHESGQSAEAEKAYYRALALNHELVEARYNLGCLFLSENKLEQAKSEFTAFTLQRPGSPEAWLRLGTAQLRSREPLAAERSFNQALRLKAQNPEALTGVGLSKLQRNRSAEAVQSFSNALKQQRDYAPALLNLAIVAQENLKDKPLALQHYRRYLDLKPARENFAAVQRLVHQLEQDLAPPPVRAPGPDLTGVPRTSNAPPAKSAVAEHLPPVLASKPASVTPTDGPLVRAVEKPAGTNKSHPAVEIAKAPGPTNEARPQPATNLSRPVELAAATQSPQPRASAPALPLEVVTVPPEQVFKPAQDMPARPAPTSPLTIASPSNPTGQPAASAAAKPAKRSFLSKINPVRIFSGNETTPPAAPQPSASSGSTIAKAETRATSRPQSELEGGAFARYTYKSPATPKPGDRSEAERAYAQGVQSKEAHRLPEAIQAYRRASQLDPAYFDACFNLGVALAEAGNLQSALAAYENALAVQPDSLDARYNFALVLKQANFPVDARNELQRLLTVYPNDSRAHLALGNLYAQQLREPAKARAHYLRVLELDPRNPQAGAIRYWLTDNPLR